MKLLQGFGFVAITGLVMAACSVDTKPIEDDDGTSSAATTGSGAGGSSSTTTVTATGTTTVTVTSTATGMAMGCGGTGCQDCINTQCAQIDVCGTESQACQSNSECTALNTCWSTCQDQTCLDNCNTMHSSGVAALEAFYTCLQCNPNACGTQCMGQSPFCI